MGHPNFQLMVDFYHLSLEKEDPAILVSAKKNIKHIHIANPAGRMFPMSADEFDYSSSSPALKKAGYKGGVSVEGAVRGLRHRGAQGARLPARRRHRGGEGPVRSDAGRVPRGRRQRQAGHPDQHRAGAAGGRARPPRPPAPAK